MLDSEEEAVKNIKTEKTRPFDVPRAEDFIF